MKDLHIYRLFSLPCPGAKQLRRPIQQLGLPLRDLVRVHIELACQLRKCPVAAHCGKSHLRLELCRVVTAGSSAHLSLLSPRALSCPQSGSDSTYPPVQISGATSIAAISLVRSLWQRVRGSPFHLVRRASYSRMQCNHLPPVRDGRGSLTLSVKHLPRYTTEFEGRHNNRPLDTSEQMEIMARGAAGNQLPYSSLIGPRETRHPRML